MNASPPLICTVFISLVMSTCASAAEIYRWVGEDGVVHYSDEKPRDGTQATTLDVVESRAPDYDPLADPYSIRNQARRLSETRTALEQARHEREQARRQAAQLDAPPLSPGYEYVDDYYAPYDYRRGWSWYSTPMYVRPARPGLGRRQMRAMDDLGLTGPRPDSINSGAHHYRVQRSASLPLYTPDLPPRPQPRPERR